MADKKVRDRIPAQTQEGQDLGVGCFDARAIGILSFLLWRIFLVVLCPVPSSQAILDVTLSRFLF